MARKLDRFPDEYESRMNTRYPYDEWLNGEPWELTHGVDFKIKVQSMRTQLQHIAKKRNGTIRWAWPQPKVLVIQYVPTPMSKEQNGDR